MKFYIPVVSLWFCKLMSVVISVGGITIWPFVISRFPMDVVTEQHEGIHATQQLEMALTLTPLLICAALATGWWPIIVWAWVPYLGPYYLLYAAFWLWGLAKYRDKDIAYVRIPFEQEAYAHEETEEYFSDRKWLAWTNYKV